MAAEVAREDCVTLYNFFVDMKDVSVKLWKMSKAAGFPENFMDDQSGERVTREAGNVMLQIDEVIGAIGEYIDEKYPGTRGA